MPTPQYESLLLPERPEWLQWLSPLDDQAASTKETLKSDVVWRSHWSVSSVDATPTGTVSSAQIETLVPAIGVALTSFKPVTQASTVVDVAAAEMAMADNVFDEKWHSWSAVAAVRVEPSTPEAPAMPELTPRQCLSDADITYQPSALAIKASPKYTVWLHNHLVGEAAGQVAAEKIAAQLRSLLQSGTLQPSQLTPLVGPDFIGVAHGGEILFVVDETLQPHPEVPAAVTAVQWVNNLRHALNEEPMALAQVQMVLNGLAETSETLYGTASWYGPYFHGRQTANGEIFDENELTAAHKTLPFNTRLKVTNRMNGRSVVVRINDRGPYIGQRSLDLSKAAARCLGSTQDGVVPYEAVILESVPPTERGEFTTAQLTLD
ncbi:septal ring lytic transglycosylase RlpA family protein [Leptolyngbya iicbica]|nr:septal ring lytic transglycosylase RlpA family protein [Leptolyngbya sp. LK]